MLELSFTEIALLVWAGLASAAAVHFYGRYMTITRLMYMISHDKELRKDFFTKHDAFFGEPK